MAFVARYGHQRIPDLRQMTVRDFACLEEALSLILQEENRPPES